MRALVYDACGTEPELRDVAEPPCPPDGVVIRVRATGVCRSDWHAWMGHDPVALPHIPGHEFAGEVLRVGPRVQDWAVGDRVTCPFVCGCGRCEVCLGGNAQVCPDQSQPGFTMPGSFAEQVAVPHADANLVRLPDAVDFVAAASLGCRFATAFRALVTHGRLGAGQVLAVYGCGGVGLSAVMIGVALGATVIAVDASDAALARAAHLGAAATIRAGADLDPAAEIHVRFGGAHVAIDALGAPATARACVHSLRRRGRHVQVGLLLGADAQTALPMDRVIAHELEIYGSHGMPACDYPALLALVADGALRPHELVGAVIALNEAGAALASFGRSSPAGMTVIALS